MTKKEAWEMFKKTGEIEYYLMYKRGKYYVKSHRRHHY